MLSSTAMIFICVGFLLSVFLHWLYLGVQRRSACYKMYAVRDQLVLLVAQNHLSKDSKIFNYYYRRVNSLLATAPKIGFDDVVHSMLHMKNGDLDKALKKNQKDIKHILSLKEMENEDVRAVVASYYQTSKHMMLVHSSYLRMLYLTMIRGGLLADYASRMISFLPNSVSDGAKALNFAKKESEIIKNHA